MRSRAIYRNVAFEGRLCFVRETLTGLPAHRVAGASIWDGGVGRGHGGCNVGVVFGLIDLLKVDG